MKIKKEIAYTITLLEYEAKYLKELLQNFQGEEESKINNEIRYSLWTALDRAGVE
jgi:hypothetical protein